MSRTSSYEIGDVTFSAVRDPLCSRQKNHAKLKSLSADHRNLSWDKSADLWSVSYHKGNCHKIGPRTCHTTANEILIPFWLSLFLGPARSLPGTRVRLTRKEPMPHKCSRDNWLHKPSLVPFLRTTFRAGSYGYPSYTSVLNCHWAKGSRLNRDRCELRGGARCYWAANDHWVHLSLPTFVNWWGFAQQS